MKNNHPGPQLNNENKYYEAVIHNSPAAIVVINSESRITEWNPAAENLFGYAREEALGNDIDNLIADDSIRAQASEYSEKTKSGEAIHLTTTRFRKDRTPVEVEVLGVPIYSDNAEVIDYMAIYHDITELQQARREALAASQTKSEFLANMSHEIRTPMNGVIGMTSLLLDTPLSPEQREYVETIRKSGDALLSIINDILDFSKIEANKLELESHPFNLRECVESALDLVAYQASDKDLELLYNVKDDVPAVVTGDVTRIRQIIANLLSNAVKFTDTGEVEVSIVKESGTPDQANLLFSIRDTGIGIPPDRTNRIFNLFSQIDASTTRRFGGTGLGLSICKRLVDLMGGNIWFESSGVPGEGTTFHFRLNFGIPKEPFKVPVPAPKLLLQGKTALIVDDNATNRLILARMTASWGMKSIVCSSGKETLQVMEKKPTVDVFLLDVQMPEMDGLTLAAELLRRTGKHFPTVILSSLGARVELPEGVNAAYLHKPIKPSHLYETLCSVLSEQEQDSTTSQEIAETFDTQMGKRHPLRILLAEDHPVNQKVVLLMLDRLGYRADVAGNGLEVLEAFNRQCYDVVLMDIQMPEMNGIQATEKLRQTLDSCKQPRIIALTANAVGGEREEYLDAGLDDYLSKPVNVLQLREALEKCMPLDISDASDPEQNPNASIEEHNKTTNSIDIAKLKEFFPYEGEDIKIIIELANEFFNDTEKRLKAMDDLILNNNAPAFGENAHAIKGASQTFGASAFSELCKEMEMMGKARNLQDASAKLELARQEFARVCNDLNRILNGMLP